MLPHHSEQRLQFTEIDSAFRADVLKGLGIKPRAIPARWLYDRRGSELFEAITALPEYYPTRTERSILSCAMSQIATLIGPKRAIVEFGSGSSAKTPILLSEVSSRCLCTNRHLRGISRGVRGGSVGCISRLADISDRSRFHRVIEAA